MAETWIVFDKDNEQVFGTFPSENDAWTFIFGMINATGELVYELGEAIDDTPEHREYIGDRGLFPSLMITPPPAPNEFAAFEYGTEVKAE